MKLKNILIALFSIVVFGISSAAAHTIGICHVQYALCAGSATVPTGRLSLIHI